MSEGSRAWRIVAVTGGLLAGGALCGAVAAVVALLAGVAVSGQLGGLLHSDWAPVLEVTCVVGAFFGGVLLPVTGFTLLRRVPLWLTGLGTVLGTIAGGATGWMLSERLHLMDWGLLKLPITGAVLGFFVAALLLRMIVQRRQRVGVEERVAVRAPAATRG